MSDTSLEAYRFSISWSRLIPSKNIVKTFGDLPFLVKFQVISDHSHCKFYFPPSYMSAGGRGHVNPKGLEYYNNLINELVKRGKLRWIYYYIIDRLEF